MKKMIRFLTTLMALCMVGCLFVSCDDTPPAFADLDFSSVEADMFEETDDVTEYVKISIEGKGDIYIRLFSKVAPETVKNFQTLVSENFYDGLIFHRVIKGFMIQGGDPKGDGTGGSPKTIKGEFNSNGFQNNLKHIRGVVSMARLRNDKNSASSQFFIMHTTYPSLDGNYASFGYVVNGMDVVDAIASVATNANDKPLEDVVITSARFVKIK